ncbi:MAG: DUF4315 family protein [Clostridia bacterium]|nr:DUF4315 family protein [Clostridia bacterium]
MNPKLEKLRAERDRLAERYASIGARLKNLDEQILNIENTDIIGIVRSTGVTIEQLAELLRLLDDNPTAAMPAEMSANDSDMEDDNEA